RAANAEGLDRTEGGRRPPGREHVALAPGPGRGRAREPGPPGHPRGLAAQLPAGGAVRRRRPADLRAGRAVAEWNKPDERQPEREWRRALARPRPTRLPRLRHGGKDAGDG